MPQVASFIRVHSISAFLSFRFASFSPLASTPFPLISFQPPNAPHSKSNALTSFVKLRCFTPRLGKPIQHTMPSQNRFCTRRSIPPNLIYSIPLLPCTCLTNRTKFWYVLFFPASSLPHYIAQNQGCFSTNFSGTINQNLL